MHKPAVIFIVVVVFILSGLLWQQSRPPVFIVSGFIEADQIRVGSQVGGRVAEVMAEEGDQVNVDAILYRIEPFDLDAALAEARSEFAATNAEFERLKNGFRKEEIEQADARWQHAQATMDRVIAGPRAQEISVAKEQVKIAKAGLELAEAELTRLGALVKKNQVSEEAHDNGIRERKAAAAEFASSVQTLSLLLEGSRKEDIAVARADVAEAEQALALMKNGYRDEDITRAAAQTAATAARLEAIQVRVDELEVKSPCNCVVEAIDLRPGDLVPANAPSVSLLDLNRLWVRTYVPEARLSKIKLGMQVPIRVDGLEDEQFMGHITFIAQGGEFTPRNIQTPEERSKQVFRVKVTLHEGRDRLRVGMATDVLFNEAKVP
jgi:HlyD family secretion protein